MQLLAHSNIGNAAFSKHTGIKMQFYILFRNMFLSSPYSTEKEVIRVASGPKFWNFLNKNPMPFLTLIIVCALEYQYSIHLYIMVPISDPCYYIFTNYIALHITFQMVYKLKTEVISCNINKTYIRKIPSNKWNAESIPMALRANNSYSRGDGKIHQINKR